MLVPRSDCQGIHWPALPHPDDATLLALQHQLEQSEWWPPETLLAAQLRQLETVLAHAARTVPYYREPLREVATLGPGELTPETWRRLPILRRADIQEAGAALVSRWPPEDHGPYSADSTSGSTGRPIEVKATRITRLMFRAADLRYHLWHGRDLSATVASIRLHKGRSAKAEAAGTALPWVVGYPSGPMVFLAVTNPIGEQLDWLARLDPEYLTTYPTNLAALLRRSEATGVRPAGLRAVWTGGEVLDRDVRAACERVWGIAPANAYSAVEIGHVALQCPDHRHLHVQAENALVEVLGEDGRPRRPGQWGRVVVTALHNFATPLIRYQIGDYAEVGEACPCGRGLAVLTRILGRTRNMLTLPSGEQFWPVFPDEALTIVKAVRQVQLVQRGLEEIDIKLVVARPLTPAEQDRLRGAIGECLRHPFRLNLVYVDEIPRSAGGKYEDFRSEIDV